MKEFNSYDRGYKRHLTLEEAEQFKREWDYKGEDEERISKITFKKKTNDYTVTYGRHYNG